MAEGDKAPFVIGLILSICVGIYIFFYVLEWRFFLAFGATVGTGAAGTVVIGIPLMFLMDFFKKPKANADKNSRNKGSG